MSKSDIVCVLLYCVELFLLYTPTTIALSENKSDVRFEIEGNYTAAVGSNFTVKCISSNPIILRRRSAADFMKEYSIVEEYPEYFVLEYKLTDLTFKDVGWFDCYEKYVDNPTNVSFYLFVDDPVHLMIGPRVARVSAKWRTPVVVPCFPTAPDVDVNSLTYGWNPVTFITDPKDEDTDKFYYHPTRGIILPSRFMTNYWYIYVCEFSKRGVKQRKYIDVFLDGGHQPDFVYLEYQSNMQRKVDAKPGTDIELAVEVFTNYNPTIRWYDPKNNEINTHNEYITVHTRGEPYETRLIIKNVSSKHDGVYRVTADNLKEIDFYVNVTDVSRLEIEMKKVFLVSEDYFTASCKDTAATLTWGGTWTFKPYSGYKDECEETGSLGFVDKMEKYGIEYQWDQQSYSLSTIVFTKHILANLTCTMMYLDGRKDSVTRPLIISEAKDGFEIDLKYEKNGSIKTVNLTCTVSRFLYSENLYWIGSDGFVMEKGREEGWRNMTVKRSETIYSYRVTLVMEVKMDHEIPLEEYKCMAVDYEHVPSFRSHILHLEGISAIITQSNMQNDSQLVAVGETLSLICYTGGSPISTLLWYKDGLIIENTGIHELELNLKINDTGRYSCQVDNFFGTESIYIDVEVYYPVHISINDTLAADGWLLKGRETERVILQCIFDDQPVQNVSWFKDHNVVFESSSITMKNNGTLLSIFPVKTEDSGFYTCGPDNGKHEELLDSLSIVVPVLGSIFTVVILFAIIYIGIRIRRLHASHMPISYRNLLRNQT